MFAVWLLSNNVNFYFIIKPMTGIIIIYLETLIPSLSSHWQPADIKNTLNQNKIRKSHFYNTILLPSALVNRVVKVTAKWLCAQCIQGNEVWLPKAYVGTNFVRLWRSSTLVLRWKHYKRTFHTRVFSYFTSKGWDTQSNLNKWTIGKGA